MAIETLVFPSIMSGLSPAPTNLTLFDTLNKVRSYTFGKTLQTILSLMHLHLPIHTHIYC